MTDSYKIQLTIPSTADEITEVVAYYFRRGAFTDDNYPSTVTSLVRLWKEWVTEFGKLSLAEAMSDDSAEAEADREKARKVVGSVAHPTRLEKDQSIEINVDRTAFIGAQILQSPSGFQLEVPRGIQDLRSAVRRHIPAYGISGLAKVYNFCTDSERLTALTVHVDSILADRAARAEGRSKVAEVASK